MVPYAGFSESVSSDSPHWAGMGSYLGKQVFTFAATNWRHMEIFGRISSAALPEVFLQIDLDLKLHSLPAT